VKRIASLLVASVALLTFSSAAPSAAASTLTLTVVQNSSEAQPTVTLFGTLKPAKKGTKVSIEILKGGKWKATKLAVKTVKLGSYKVTTPAEASEGKFSYRATVKVGTKSIRSKVKTISIKPAPVIAETKTLVSIDKLGPGNRIHGADISRWQHPNDAAIDFKQMYAAGVRFVMIKASDTRDDADALSVKYVSIDRAQAQAAGIYTGFYHYAVLPNSSSPEVFIADAEAQAQKAAWRLASLGGYGERDLPYALDLENNCVVGTTSNCKKYASKKLITLWAKTFLASLKSKTSRTPILYSYSSFLEGAMVRDDELRQYPLWLAHYAVDPNQPAAEPGLKASGCYVHSWTTSACTSEWTVWQYSSCGTAEKYGVPGARLDLNVFRGEIDAFLNLLKGTWAPTTADQMPKNESSQLVLKSLTATTAGKSVTAQIDVFRPTGAPVVTGTVRFYPNPSTPITPAPTQFVERASSGSWKLSIKGIPAGTWIGEMGFTDATGTHADSRVPVQFVVADAVPEPPAPSPTPKPSPTKKPSTGGCSNELNK
jgi:GH25 family lysozyme M1 (1,4-beta-N-acetylmuramidase)